MKRFCVVICGLGGVHGFGASFIPVFRDHPGVRSVGLFDTNPDTARAAAEYYGIDRLYGSFDEVLRDPDADAVFLATPIPLHETQSLAVLESGKHCACAVPMGVTLEGLERIVRAQEKTGRTYMMMETTLYTRQYLYTRELLDAGKMGRLQLLRGVHFQDMEHWPEYWQGLPPMHYGTHATAPLVGLAGRPARRVVCLGSGSMRTELREHYGNPFPVECALLDFGDGLAGEVTRSLFETARGYLEGMYAYGSLRSVEWGYADSDPLTVTELVPSDHRGFETPTTQVPAPPCFMSLPESIRRYTVAPEFYDESDPERSLLTALPSAHHGSHPHLVHEFITALEEGRRPAVDARKAANITAVGLCAHQSAMAGGRMVEIPEFALF